MPGFVKSGHTIIRSDLGFSFKKKITISFANGLKHLIPLPKVMPHDHQCIAVS